MCTYVYVHRFLRLSAQQLPGLMSLCFRGLMSFGPGGANASSAAQPAATDALMMDSAEQPVDPAAQPEGLDVRWQVEHSRDQWWDIPVSAVIDKIYAESKPAVTYSYDWGDGRISRYEIHFARREQVNIDTRRVRRVRRVFVETSVQALM